MHKDDKPIERTLAPGSLVPTELVDLLESAAADATYTSIRVRWSDDHTSRITDIAELAPIEDVRNLASVSAYFWYGDKSELEIHLYSRAACTVSAVGKTARTRQTVFCDNWAVIPGRSRISTRRVNQLDILEILLFFSTAALSFGGLAVPDLRSSAAFFLLTVAWMLIVIGVCLYLRSTPGRKARGHLVVDNRNPQTDVSKIVSGIVGIAGLALAVVAYLHPRK